MSFLLRVGGFSLILGTLLYTVGGFASFSRASIAAVTGGAAESSQTWLVSSNRIGIALMVLGCAIAVAAVLTVIGKMFSRNMRKGRGQQVECEFPTL